MFSFTKLCVVSLFAISSASALAFDHSHHEWTSLLGKHVQVAPDGNSSRVDYQALTAHRAQFRTYLDSLSAVPEMEYRGWSKPQRLAFLINAYNAWTIALVLSRYPDLKSIKDIGSVFQSPWKKKFISLFGQELSLDEIEHGMIRVPGAFDDPRIHAAVVCASVGCPMLRAEAFTADQIESQLEDGMRRFLSDSSRNRFDADSGHLRVSKIFDWYSKDFERGHKGFSTLKKFFARYADQLAQTPAARERVRRGDYTLDFLDYDWRLNDTVKNAAG